jgi:DNA-binding transcriptional LysR family regulator
MDRLLLMNSFARAVETGSFSAVARELGTTQPNISRHVASLERYLGTRLLRRSTRKLSLTPEGERYYAEARRLLDAVAEAESSVRGDDTAIGDLHITCPTSLARTHVLPRVSAFLKKYPQVRLKLQVSDRFVDLIEDGIDVAIRIGALKDGSLRARRIGTAERICVASPDYLRRRGIPLTPADLSHHDCVRYTLLSSGNVWTFKNQEIAVGGRVSVNTPDGVVCAVRDGLGIGYAPVWLFASLLKEGRIRAILVDHRGPPMPIHAIYADARLLPRRARAFIDFIAEEFAGDRSLNDGAMTDILDQATRRRRGVRL